MHPIKSPAHGHRPLRIIVFEEQRMIHPTIYGKKTLAIAGSILLCGSMGLAQTQPGNPGGGAPGGQGSPSSVCAQLQIPAAAPKDLKLLEHVGAPELRAFVSMEDLLARRDRDCWVTSD